MDICPKCVTLSIASDNKCLNCGGTVIRSKVYKPHRFIDCMVGLSIILSVGWLVLFFMYVKF